MRAKYIQAGSSSHLLMLSLACALVAARPAVASARSAEARARGDPTARGVLVLLQQELPGAAQQITAQAGAGVVVLRGSVDTIGERSRAVTLAKAVRGVRAVIDRIRVRPSFRPDSALVYDVETRVVADPLLEAASIDVSARGGVVSLSGTVDSFAAAARAGRIARTVEGVARVHSTIEVERRTQPHDGAIEQELIALFEDDPYLGDGIEVAVRGGRVSLRGTARSAAAKARAFALSWVGGVRRVDTSALKVRRQPRDPRRDQEPVLTDAELVETARALIALRDDASGRGRLQATASVGTLHVRGAVLTLAARRQLEGDLGNIAGVRAVNSRLRVRPLQPLSDEEVARACRAALQANEDLAPLTLRLQVLAGTVHVRGEVPAELDRQLAVAVLSEVWGVRALRDEMAIAPQQHLRPDLEIVSSFVRARSRAEASLASVRLIADDGVAVLRGEVPSWRDYFAAQRLARAFGARRVVNELRVGGQS